MSGRGFVETAAVAGGVWWVEHRAAIGLAAASRATPDADEKVALATLARHARWRADQWFSVLPTQPGIDPASLGVAPADAPAALVAAAGPVDRAAFAAAVGPWLLAATRGLAEATDPVREAPTRRTALRVLADLEADLRSLER